MNDCEVKKQVDTVPISNYRAKRKIIQCVNEFNKISRKFTNNSKTLTGWVFTTFPRLYGNLSITDKTIDKKHYKEVEETFKDLPQRTKYILLNRKFTFKPLKTFSLLAEELKLTRQRIKQIEFDGLRKLAKNLTKN